MRKDYLPNTNINIYQDENMFRMNTDTRLLGQFMIINEHDTVLDIGTNNGALLLYASQYTDNKLIGVDIQDKACELARYNLNYNNIKNYEVICSDIKDVLIDSVDVILCNPPFFKAEEHSNLNESEYLKIARHEIFLSLDNLMLKVKELLKENGRFYLVHRSSRLSDIIEIVNKHRLCITKIRFVYDVAREDSTALLVEITKQYKDLIIEKEKVVLRV